MTRAFNLAMTEAQVVRHCRENNIAVSTLEALPDGGVRLVCMTGYGARQISSKLKSNIIEGEPRRARFRPASPLW